MSLHVTGVGAGQEAGSGRRLVWLEDAYVEQMRKFRAREGQGFLGLLPLGAPSREALARLCSGRRHILPQVLADACRASVMSPSGATYHPQVTVAGQSACAV